MPRELTEEDKAECRKIALNLQDIAPGLFLYAMSEVEEFGGFPGDVLKSLLRAQHTAYDALSKAFPESKYTERLQAVTERWKHHHKRFGWHSEMWVPLEDFDDMLERWL